MTDSTADILRAAAARLTLPGARIPVAPRLVQPLADWLNAEEFSWEGDEVHSRCSPWTCTLAAALTVARALLDGQAPQEPASTPDPLREEYAAAIDATRHPDGTPDAAPTVGDWERQRQRAEVAETRLRLAHQARRAKAHQLDDIRRALCDAEFMQDTDPYSHADLADVIRQATPTAAAGAAIARVRALADDMRNWCSYRGMALHYADTILAALDGPTPEDQ